MKFYKAIKAIIAKYEQLAADKYILLYSLLFSANRPTSSLLKITQLLLTSANAKNVHSQSIFKPFPETPSTLKAIIDHKPDWT